MAIRYAIPIPAVKPEPFGPFETVSYKGEDFVHCQGCSRYGRPGWAHGCGKNTNWNAHPQEILDQEALPLPDKIGPDVRNMVLKYGCPPPGTPPLSSEPYRLPMTRQDMLDVIQGRLPSPPAFDPPAGERF